jgi:hypothetical protein
MSDALRELLVSFNIEVNDEELKHGEKEVEGFGAKLKEFGALVAEAFALHEVKEFIEGQIEAGAQLKVTAERLGTTTDELQAMRLAAGEAGVSVESMDTSLRILNRNIGKASDGGGEQAATFAKLGIALKDAGGLARPVGDIMGDIADKVAETGSTAEKTRISMELLGRGGSQLIPLLNKGGEAFKEATKDVADLGGGMSGEFVEAAHKAEEANVRLGFAMTGLKSTVAGTLIPGFMHLVEGMTDFVKTGIDVEKKSHIIEDALGFLKAGVIVGGVYKLVTGLRELATAEGIAAALNPFTLWVVGIGLALLAYNDLRVALEGGKSVFGDYFGQTGIAQLNTMMKEGATATDILGASLGTVLDILKFIGNTAEYVGDKLAGTVHRANAAIGRGVRRVTGAKETDADRAEEGLADAADARAVDRAHDAQGNRNAEAGRWAGVASRTGKREGVAGADTPEEWDRKHGILPGGGLARPALNFTRTNVQSRAASVPVAEGGGRGAEGGSHVTVNQSNPVKIEVHTNATDAAGTAKAVGRAVSTEQQRNNAAALNAFELP